MSLKLALKLCGFQGGEWFSVAAIRDREIRPGCFNDVSQAESFLAQYVGWNQYICGNPVREGCTGKPRLEDVVAARVMLIDADPQTHDADTHAAITKITSWLMSCGQAPSVINSGRGTQAWLRCTLTPDERRALSQHLARIGATPNVKFDATHNADRLMRLPGSTNTKTGRVATVQLEGEGEVFTSSRFAEAKIPPATETTKQSAAYCTDPATEADMALLIGPARAVWDEPAEKGERSKRDFRLVLHLLRAGASEEQACRLLYAMPASKAAQDKRGREYWEATLASVRRHLQDEERLRARAFALPEAAKQDAGAPFEPEALDALLLVRTGDEADWQRLRAALKASKIPIRALEQAMMAREQFLYASEPCRIRFVADAARRVGWFKQTQDEGWVQVDGTEARATMRAQGQDPDAEVKALTDAPWTLVNEPFAPEELEGRQWNKDGARFAFKPELGDCPTWRLMLDHVGRSIDAVVLADDWCKHAGVKTGGQYLLKWCASMFQRPKSRTAYLFLHGPQEAGKSTLHEALKDLLLRGYVRANHALKSKEGFNGEIANAVLCVIEEVDLSDNRRDTFERVKDWVTGEVISVRALYRQAVDFVNTTHWIQCAQKRAFMPVLPGDTRITELYVEHADNPIPKDVFRARLREEGPQFLHVVLHEPLPEQTGRLFIPALSSQGKTEQAGAARTELEEWMDSHPWTEVTEEQMISAFLDWLPMGSKGSWTRGRVLRELPPTARRDRALAVALRGALGATPLPVSSLFGALTPAIQTDWKSPVALGRALRRLRPLLNWLEMKTVHGLDVWYVTEVKK
jgi:hypothetical protein